MHANEQPESTFDDYQRPFRQALRLSLAGLAVVAVVCCLVFGLSAGGAGIWGALLGVAVGGAFALLTVASMLFTANQTPAVLGAIVLGGWLLKLVLLMIVLAVLRNYEFYDKWALFLTVCLVVVVSLGAEVGGVLKTSVTYVQLEQQ